jgi:hypothetical protein
MGAIARNAANNITTSGVFTSGAITNSSVTGITVLAGVGADGITLISSQTASASASISFTTGLDSTYKAYKFVFSNIHIATDGAEFTFNGSTDSGSNYNVNKTTTYFLAEHDEAGAGGSLSYQTARDLGSATTTYQDLGVDLGNDNDHASNGSLIIFNPSSTTYVKHFICTLQQSHQNDLSLVGNIAGYLDTTSAINAIQFKMNSGNIDSGTIYLYGIK